MCLAIPGEVLSLETGSTGLPEALVGFGGVRKRVCLAYTPEAAVGDYVLVHVGFAIARLDPGEASRVFRELEAMGAVEEVEDETGVDSP
ncbi:MAG: HypC/HybG/HupF family hydrogenase formation chaperone [Bryobacteraceae bacterium]